MAASRVMVRFVRAAAGAAIAATCVSTATAATIVVEPFGSGWTPGTTWATSGNFTPQVVTDNTQTPATALRLTSGSPGLLIGLLSYATALPTSEGLDIRFKMAQWAGTINGGSRTADGLTFFLRKGSESSNAAGWLGGSLGYAPWANSQDGLAGGLVGVGFDQWGNFTDTGTDGANCAGLGQAAPGFQDNTIGIRGPGTGTTGYCYLGRTTAGAVQFGTTTNTRDGRARSVRITVDPATQANPKITVYYGATASATPTQVLQVAAPAALLAEPTYRFGFTGSTATNTQNNEVWDLQVSNLISPPASETPTTAPAGATTSPASASTGASEAAAATDATFVRAAGGRSVVLMRVRASGAGRLIASGARGAGWKTRAITPKSVAVPGARTVTVAATITPATRALLRTRGVKVRLAVTMVSPGGARTTSYRTITLRRTAPLPVAG